MLKQERTLLWQFSALALGAALPSVLVGRGIMFGLLGLGIIAGLLATKGASLRGSLQLLQKSALPWLVAGWCALLWGVSWYGIAPEYSLHKTGQITGMLVVALLLYLALREMPGKYVSLLMGSLSVTTLAMAALALTDFLVGSERLALALHGQDPDASGPVSANLYRLNFFSSVLAVLLPFVAAYHLVRSSEGKNLARMAFPFALPLVVVAILVCGGRAGWVALAVSLAVLLPVLMRFHQVVWHAKHWATLALTFAVGFGGYAYGVGWDKFLERLEITAPASPHVKGLGSGRLDIWQHALSGVSEHWLTGIGTNAFRYYGPERVDAHPHNFVIQLLLETGVPGLVLAVLILGLLGYKFYQFSRGNVYGAAALASLLAFVTAGLFNTSVFNIWWFTVLLVITLIGWRAGWSGQPRPRVPGALVHAFRDQPQPAQG